MKKNVHKENLNNYVSQVAYTRKPYTPARPALAARSLACRWVTWPQPPRAPSRAP